MNTATLQVEPVSRMWILMAVLLKLPIRRMNQPTLES